MVWVEMMGQSGVGKSYWFKRIIRHEYPDLTPEAVLQRRADLSEIELSKKGRVKHFLRTLGLLPERYVRGLDIEILTFLTQTYGVVQADDLNRDILRYLDTLWRYNGDCKDPLRRAKMISFVLHRRLPEFIALSKITRPGDVVVFEDGIMHLNGGITRTYLGNETLSSTPDFVIHLNADASYVLENRLRRLAEGRGTPDELGLSREALQDLCAKAKERYQRKIECLVNHGTHLFSIDAQAKDTQVAQSIRRALHTIQEART
jgi:hypothetical protein